MTANVDPVLGNWYRHLDKGYEFQVVAYDDTGGVVEIQHLDGDVEALEIDEWYGLEVEHIEPLEEWEGSMDDYDNDELKYSEAGMVNEDWSEDQNEWHEEH